MKYTKYGEAAIQAYKNVSKVKTPQQAWEDATCYIFGKGTESQKKHCPKGVFIGLCALGKNKNMSTEDKTNLNMEYAYRILEEITSPNKVECTKEEQWKRVLNKMGRKIVQEEGRIGVVEALYDAKLISARLLKQKKVIG